MRRKELDQLYLTKNERTGDFILFILLLALIIIPWLYYDPPMIVTKSEIKIPSTYNRSEVDMNTHIDSISNPTQVHVKYQNYIESNDKTDLFEFDPNHLEANEAKRLGIHEKSYRALQNYLATGAKIYDSKQFSRIYGIDNILFKKIENWRIKFDLMDIR